MDDEYSFLDNFERILQDPNVEPFSIPWHHLKFITNNFSKDRELGKGGFGVVYKGVLPSGETIAVKYLSSMSQCHEKQFKNEVDNLMKVRNKNVVRFLGYCYETSQKYTKYNGMNVFAEMPPERLLCFEYVPNGSLDKYISDESCGLDWHQRYKIIKGICYGLNYLHNECQVNGSLIHLDLKPENILLDDDMVPKIADFGLAKLFDDTRTQTLATSLIGSQGYMAPEYLLEGIISTMADMYSLGVIIVLLITGQKHGPSGTEAFCGAFVEAVLQNWKNRLSSASLETDYQQIDSCLEIGIRCIKYDRRKRPNIKEVIEILHRREITYGYVSDVGRLRAKEAHKPIEFLEITPLNLCLSWEQNKLAPGVLKITNKTDDCVAFYITVSKAKNSYHIEQDRGLLIPRTASNIVVTLERGHSPWLFKCKDEILVQGITMWGYGAISMPLTADIFNNKRNDMVQKVNVTVVYTPLIQEVTQSRLEPMSAWRDDEEKNMNQLLQKKKAWISKRSAIIDEMVNNLGSPSLDEQKSAVARIRSLAENAEESIMVGMTDAIPALVKLLYSKDLEIQEQAVAALLSFSIINDTIKTLIVAADAIVPMIQVLRIGSMEARQCAATTIYFLSEAEGNDNKIEIGCTIGAFEALIELMQIGNSSGTREAAMAMLNLCKYRPNKVRAVRAGILPPLIQMLLNSSTTGDKITEALALLQALLDLHECKTAILYADAKPVLEDILYNVEYGDGLIAANILHGLDEDKYPVKYLQELGYQLK